MKMTISNKLMLAFSFITLLIVAAGLIGAYGVNRFQYITSFLTNEAWDTADGGMEGTIGLQKQIILVNEIMLSQDRSADFNQHVNQLSEGRKFTIEALDRVKKAALIEKRMISELDQNLALLDGAEKQLFDNFKNSKGQSNESAQLFENYMKVANNLLAFLEEFEPVADSKVEDQKKQIASLSSSIDVLVFATIALGVVAATIIYLVMKNQVSAPLETVAKRLYEIAHGDGDLTVRLPIKGEDEIADLSMSFNTFVENMRGTLSDIAHAASQIATASEKMIEISQETHNSVSIQQTETTQVASATSEMASTVEEVARNAAAAAEAATSANNEAVKGKDIVLASTQNIDSLATQVGQTAEIISHLEEDSNSIGSILDVIKDIAEQTNLLALNAAIEAARAGEMGRGFAVVADEVRNLAQRTQASTREIQEMIEKLQDRAQNAARAMEAGRNQAQNTVAQAHEAANALASIARAVASINDMNMQIAAAAEEQSAVTEEINKNITSITQHVEETARASRSTASTGQELGGLAVELTQHIRHYRF